MPTDYKRYNGPEDSVSYKEFTNKINKCIELLNDQNQRRDGRAVTNVGEIYVNMNVVTEAKGSAYIEMRNTKVVCSVYHPRDIPQKNEFSLTGELYCEVKFASFSCPRQRRALAPDAEERALSVELKKALDPAVCRHMFPNYQVDVLVYIIEHDGSCLAAAINAAGLALINAAVPMYDVITSLSLSVFRSKFFVDPTEEEEYQALMDEDVDQDHGIVTISTLSQLKQICHIQEVGSMDVETLNKIIDHLFKECETLQLQFKQCIIKYVKKSMNEKCMLDEEAKERLKMVESKIGNWRIGQKKS